MYAPIIGDNYRKPRELLETLKLFVNFLTLYERKCKVQKKIFISQKNGWQSSI